MQYLGIELHAVTAVTAVTAVVVVVVMMIAAVLYLIIQINESSYHHLLILPSIFYKGRTTVFLFE